MGSWVASIERPTVRLVLVLGLALAAIPATVSAAIDEWLGRRFESVAWRGNDAVSGSRLGAATDWKPGRILLESSWNRLDVQVHRLYAELGYLDAHVRDVAFSPDGESVRAEVQIDEGPRYRFGEVSVSGTRALSEAEILAEIGVQDGDPWSGPALEAGVQRLLARYAEAGRPFTQVHVRDVQVDDGRADVELLVVEGGTVLVDSVVVTGLTTTRAGVVERVLGSLESERYDPRHAARARERLVDLGVFAEVSEPYFELTAPGRGLLRYEVEEAATNSFDGAFGYQGQGQALVGLARVHIGNLAGTARQADLFWQSRGRGVSEFQVRYQEPFVFGLPLRAGLALDHELQDTSYTQTRIGVAGTLVLGHGTEATFGFNTGRVVSGTGPVAESNRRGTNVEITRRIGVRYGDGLGRRASSHRFTFLAGQEFTTDRIREGGEHKGSLSTVGVDALTDRPNGRNRFVTLDLRTRLRLADVSYLPVYDRFSLGGTRTLRGYREDAYRTSRYALLRSELGWLAGGSRLFFFLDQSVFYQDPSSSDSTEGGRTRYRAGYGVGAAIPSAVGRFGLDIGWGEGTRPLDAKLHVRLTNRF